MFPPPSNPAAVSGGPIAGVTVRSIESVPWPGGPYPLNVLDAARAQHLLGWRDDGERDVEGISSRLVAVTVTTSLSAGCSDKSSCRVPPLAISMACVTVRKPTSVAVTL